MMMIALNCLCGETIRSSSKRITAIPNSLRNNIRREVGHQIFKLTLLEEPPPDNPGGRVTGVGDGEGELFSKSCCDLFVVTCG